MSLAFQLCAQINDTPDDRTRFRLLVDAIRALEERWPQPGDIARVADVREAELRLQKEIDQVRVDLKSTEANLRTAIHRQSVWIIGAVAGLIRLLDRLLAL